MTDSTDKSGKSKGKSASAGEFRYSSKVGTALLDGATFRAQPVQYLEIDGMAIFEGDIVLGTKEDVDAQTDVRRAEASGLVARGVVITGDEYRWPNCLIPYQIDPGLTNQSRVTDAITHWQDNTNFNFVLRTPANQASYPDYVDFVPGSGCSSWVGRQGGRQAITLGAGCSTGNAIHEIGHAVGLWHEQSREDRDAFVTILWANIISGTEANFFQHITDGDDVGAYDYGSIMHYPRTAFSRNGNDTIVPTDPAAVIGQRTALSPGDIAAANSLCETPGTPLKTLDDLTMKVPDDGIGSNKRIDDLTIKTRDDGVATIKRLDDITLKAPDDGITIKVLDDIGTLKRLDDGTPRKVLDDPITPPHTANKLLDDPLGPGTPTKPLDDVKAAGYDTIRQPRPPVQPFVLVTPHHAPAAAVSAAEAASAGVDPLTALAMQAVELDEQIAQLSALVAELASEQEGLVQQIEAIIRAVQGQAGQ
jgi:hypothetical protein